jgi:hypothetical protein
VLTDILSEFRRRPSPELENSEMELSPFNLIMITKKVVTRVAGGFPFETVS